jgi:dephospho-CoA kinase
MILGLTGSVGSGKSTVARMLEVFGRAIVIDADAITRQMQTPGGTAYAEIVKTFGPELCRKTARLTGKSWVRWSFPTAKNSRC